MDSNEVILITVSSALLISTVVFAAKYFGFRSKVSMLSKSIDEFIRKNRLTDISLKDDRFAEIQNNIAELENLLIIEKSKTEYENKKNADFTADISHQLKTPIAGLRLYCEMDNEENPNERNRKELQLVSRLEKLVYNLLRLEKIHSDAYEMNFQNNSVDSIAEEIIGELKSVYPGKLFSLKGSGNLRCDRGWLSEAIENIIKNSAEHTSENGRIEVSIDSGDTSLTVIVEDNGGGLPEEQLIYIFKRFYKTEKASPDSTGIGLSISKAIIEKHHGTITAENGKEGLKVIMVFPLIEGAEKIN